MKILMISPHAPYPPNSGGRIRQWEEISYLGKRHDLTVVSFAFTEEEYEQRKVLEGLCSRAIVVLHSEDIKQADIPLREKLPWPLQWYATTEMYRTLEGLSAFDYDAVMLEYIFMAQYRNLFAGNTILMEHNIESQIYKQYADRWKAPADKRNGKNDRAFWHATWMVMVNYENQTWPLFPLRATVSLRDKAEMENRCPQGKTIVIENGVNTGTVRLFPVTAGRKILFMGSLDYFPNTDGAFYMAKTVMPLVWENDPGITLCIAGRNPPDSVRALTSDSRVEVIPDPEDMHAVARDCCMTVVPLHIGGGTRLKILESMAMGLPVVSTTLGCEGLSVTDGDDILMRDDPKGFANAILQIITQPAVRDRLRSRGRKLVEDRYDWRYMYERLENEMFTLVDESRRVRQSQSQEEL